MAEDVFSKFRLDGKTLALRTIKNKIEQFIASGTYHDLEDFISDNSNLEIFQNHTKLNNTLRKVWGYRITEEDYQEILSQLRQELAERKKIAMENVHTFHANGKEITTFQSENGNISFDNSYANQSMESQLEDLQAQHQEFQTGGENNIDAMMNYMEEEIKPSVEVEKIVDIDSSSLNQEEKQKLEVAKQFDKATEDAIQVDLDSGVIIHEDGVSTIEQRDGEFGVYSSEEQMAQEMEQEEMEMQPKTKVLTLGSKQQAGFSNALIIIFLTGLVIGFLMFMVFLR